MRHWLTAGMVLALVAACLWSGWRKHAFAHANPAVTTPADGAELAEPPTAIEIRFTEHVVPDASRILLFDGDGTPVPGTSLTAPDNYSLMLALPVLAPGRYKAEWEVQSTDTHMAAGLIRFAVGTVQAEQRHTKRPPPMAVAAAAGVGLLIVCGVLVRTVRRGS